MSTTHDEDRILGDYPHEMERRNKNKNRRLLITLLNLFCAYALVWFAIQPLNLDVWHQLAFFVGLFWLLNIAETPASNLADELDLLEKKIVLKFNQIDEPNLT